MLVVKPWISVESPSGAICQSVAHVFWFSTTMGFWLDGGAVVAIGADGGVGAGGTALVLGPVGTAMLIEVAGPPGTASVQLRTELAGAGPGVGGAPFGLNRSPPNSANERVSPTLTGVLPSASTTVPLVGSSVIVAVTRVRPSLGTGILSAVPRSEPMLPGVAPLAGDGSGSAEGSAVPCAGDGAIAIDVDIGVAATLGSAPEGANAASELSGIAMFLLCVCSRPQRSRNCAGCVIIHDRMYRAKHHSV